VILRELKIGHGVASYEGSSLPDKCFGGLGNCSCIALIRAIHGSIVRGQPLPDNPFGDPPLF